MATSSKDIEILWKRYSDEGVKKGISVTQFFESMVFPTDLLKSGTRLVFNSHP